MVRKEINRKGPKNVKKPKKLEKIIRLSPQNWND